MNTNKNECFAYTRVSTVKQSEGVSLEAQREAIERYASQHGLFIVRWFEEKETAAKQGRPVFTEMIKLLHGQNANGLIMHKIDRSARNLRDWATVGELQDHGIAVHFAAESVDFSSRGGRLTADIQAVIAADYIRNLKEEIRKGQIGRLKQGLYPFTAPYGYVDQGKGQPKAIDPERGPFVRTMFELYATGEYSLPSLEAEMYRRGMRSVGNRKVYKSKIETILANPFYMGIIHLKRHPQPYNGIHEPLVPVELFKKVQRVKRDRSRKKKTKHNLLFRGLFNCHHCGNAMIGEKQRAHVYYRCHTTCCPSNSINETALEWAILQQLKDFKMPKDAQANFDKAFSSWASRQEHQGKSVVQMEAAKIDAQLERLTEGYLAGLIDEKTFRTKKQSFELRQLELSKQSQQQQSRVEFAENSRKFLEHIKSLSRTYFYAEPDEKRQLVKMLFSNMSVFAKNVDLEPKIWVQHLLNQDLVLLGAPDRATSRSRTELGSSVTQNVLDVSNCRELAEFVKLAEAIGNKTTANKLTEPETPNVFQQAV